MGEQTGEIRVSLPTEWIKNASCSAEEETRQIGSLSLKWPSGLEELDENGKRNSEKPTSIA